MKKYLLLYKILFLSIPAIAQLNIPWGTQWINSEKISIVVSDLDFVNNGSFSNGGNVRFTGNQNSSITGTSVSSFNILEIAKAKGMKVILGKNINVNSSVNFSGGFLDLNSNEILLGPAAVLSGESESSRLIGSGGYVEITQALNAPVSSNPGNLGVTITSNTNLGATVIRRGVASQSGTGLSASIQRYYLISPQNNNGLNATLRLAYFDAELNGQNENVLVQFQSTDNGASWNNLSLTKRSADSNYVEKAGVNSLSLQTLGSDMATNAVTGLIFNVKRKKTTEVQLAWSTTTETNMLGFEVQRKLDYEADFSDKSFINSKAPGGNSNSTLSYSYNDPNSYTGTSYYRLKIMGKNNVVSYSDVKSVAGKVKNTNNLLTLNDTDALETLAAARSPQNNTSFKNLSVGPNPNNGSFWFMLNGIDRQATVELYGIDGKLVRQFYVANLQRQQVNGLTSGIYFLKTAQLAPFKIIVQNDGSPHYNSNNDLPIKN